MTTKRNCVGMLKSLNTRRIYMKSSTSFNGESDQGGDDR